MNSIDFSSSTRLSPFAQRLSSKVAAFSNRRQGYAMSRHSHDCDMLFVPVAGRFELVDGEGRPLKSEPGHFVFFSAGVGHSTIAQTLRQTHLAVYVDPDFWGVLLRAQGSSDRPEGMRRGSRALDALARELLRCADSGPGMDAAPTGALVMEAARLCLAPELSCQATPARWIAELLADRIDVYLARPLTDALEELATAENLSRRQVERIFRAHHGSSPLEFQQARRAERARRLLEETEDSVLSIAQQVGWESGSYLARVIERRWHATPLEIRQAGRRAKGIGSLG